MATRRRASKRSNTKQTAEDEKEELRKRKEKYLYDPYRLTKPVVKQKEWGSRRKNDAANPNNIFGLGEHCRGIWRQDRKIQKWIGANPLDLFRNEWKEPGGLMNHGATCYVSSLLQCWFFLPVLRSAVYQYDEASHSGNATNTEGTEPASSASSDRNCITSLSKQMRNLQELFSRMQLSCASYFRTEPLLRSLSLSLGVQQDVQEFNKLLLAHLSKTFKGANVENVQEVVEKVFEGTSSWQTKCSECPFISEREESFLELSVPLLEKNNLQEDLNSLFAPEYLCDDNKYYCPQCDKKCEAIRQQKIKHAPPVLNLQLLRFVYDLKTFTKKKLQHQIDFPSDLTLSDGTTSHNYRLTALIHHHGDSPYAGHYTVDVWDNERMCWWTIDDEVVASLKPKEDENDNGDSTSFLSAIASTIDSREPNTLGLALNNSQSIDKLPLLLQKPAEYPENERTKAKKKSVYMLVYTKVIKNDNGNEQQVSTLVPWNIRPPASICTLIAGNNDVFCNNIKSLVRERAGTWYEILLRREIYKQIFLNDNAPPIPTNEIDPRLESVAERHDTWVWVPAEWLSRWVCGFDESGLQQNSNSVQTENDDEITVVEEDQQKSNSHIGNNGENAQANEKSVERKSQFNSLDVSENDQVMSDTEQTEEDINSNFEPNPLTSVGSRLKVFNDHPSANRYLDEAREFSYESSKIKIPPDAVLKLKRLTVHAFQTIMSGDLREDIIRKLEKESQNFAFQMNSTARTEHGLHGFLSTVCMSESPRSFVCHSECTSGFNQQPELTAQSCFKSTVYGHWKSATELCFALAEECADLGEVLQNSIFARPPAPDVTEHEVVILSESEGSPREPEHSYDVFAISTQSYRSISQICKLLPEHLEESKLLDRLVARVRYLFMEGKEPGKSEAMHALCSELVTSSSVRDALQPVNKDIQCPHNSLTPKKNTWKYISGSCWRRIANIFDATTFKVEKYEDMVCSTCKKQKEFIQEEQEAERENRRREIQSSALQRLLRRHKGHPTGGAAYGLPLSLPTGSYFLVKRQWLNQWRDYVDEKSSSRPQECNLWDELKCNREKNGQFLARLGIESGLETVVPPDHLRRFLNGCVRTDPSSVFQSYIDDDEENQSLAQTIPGDGAEEILIRENEENDRCTVELVPEDEFLELCELYSFVGYTEETKKTVQTITSNELRSEEYRTALRHLPAPLLHFLPTDELPAAAVNRRLKPNSEAHVINAMYSIIFDPPINPFSLNDTILHQFETLYNFESGNIYIHFLQSTRSEVPNEARTNGTPTGRTRKRLRKRNNCESLPASSNDTIQLLKMRIMESFGTDTLGSLYYIGQELLDYQTLKECNVPCGGHLFWKPSKEKVGDDQWIANKLAESKACSEQEEGFSGSALQGN